MKTWPLLWRYLLVRPSVKSYGVWSIASEAIVFAFGRNDVPDERLFRIADELRRHQGDPGRTLESLRTWFNPGQPNRRLAEALLYLLRVRPTLIAYVQWEVVVAIDPLQYDEVADRIHVIWPTMMGDSLDSSQVIDEAITLGFGRRTMSVLVVAHELMIIRLIFMLRRRLRRHFVAAFTGARGFDLRSIQGHTARSWHWYLRETIGRWVVLPLRRLV